MPEETKQQKFSEMPEVPEAEKLEWCYENIKRLIYFANTLEHWRHAKFRTLDEVIAAEKEEANGTTETEKDDSKGADGTS